uniref:Vesicle transport protein GOT1B n=1 Tax=Ciona intestinalis TaxID=7719 RepID=H2Y1H3_CIOIN|nr:vesicle transport protein GOT1B [Ciona intestinalis]|eukprot:XP_002130219.1 vesicle transport protein GOT1B [Ciona intestinalis]
MLSVTDSQKIGIGLTGFGAFFLFLGMIFFFDRVLLAFGNLLFISGLSFIIGLQRTFNFFFQRHKIKSSGFFFTGIFVVLLGWPLIGMLIETYGFFLLFSGFFPVIINFLRRIPVIGRIFDIAIINKFAEKLEGQHPMV